MKKCPAPHLIPPQLSTRPTTTLSKLPSPTPYQFPVSAYNSPFARPPEKDPPVSLSLAILAQAPTPATDPSVFYYGYSTIAQALAGAFGFLAAIVLYRLQALNVQMENHATRIIGDPKTFLIEPFRTLFAYQRWNLFVEHVKKDQDSSNRNPTFKNLNFLDLGAMDHANHQILTIRMWFIISMILTVATISLCLIALVLMAWGQSLSFLIYMLIMSLVSLAAYARLMFTVLQ